MAALLAEIARPSLAVWHCVAVLAGVTVVHIIRMFAACTAVHFISRCFTASRCCPLGDDSRPQCLSDICWCLEPGPWYARSQPKWDSVGNLASIDQTSQFWISLNPFFSRTVKTLRLPSSTLGASAAAPAQCNHSTGRHPVSFSGQRDRDG